MNPYIPKLASITKIKKETPTVKTFEFKFKDYKKFSFIPGQFILVSVFGIGESPFGIFNSGKHFGFSVKKVGNVTKALFEKKRGEIIGIRGPYGKGYPLNEFEGKDILLIAGGIGIPPIRALLNELLKRRKKYGEINLFYGAKVPEEIVYKKEIREWENKINVHLTVDKGTKGWKGKVGVVTTLLEDIKVSRNSVAAVCGPPIMIKFVVKTLKEKGMRENQIYASMERLMQCGMGVCGRCNIGRVYVCKDGPVFRVDELLKLTERVW